VPRWSRPRSLELVAGSGTRSGSDDVYDIHGNLSKGRSHAHGADHPITCTPLQNGDVLVASRKMRKKKEKRNKRTEKRVLFSPPDDPWDSTRTHGIHGLSCGLHGLVIKINKL